MIEAAVLRMYSETEENRSLEVTYANGDKEVLYFKDFNSGAMIQNIVDRGKKMATKEYLATNQKGMRLQHPLTPARTSGTDPSALTRRSTFRRCGLPGRGAHQPVRLRQAADSPLRRAVGRPRTGAAGLGVRGVGAAGGVDGLDHREDPVDRRGVADGECLP
jgi:hypothetical protein